MKTKKESTKKQSANNLKGSGMVQKKEKKIAKSVYESCIANSYLGSEEGFENTVYYRDLEILMKKHEDEIRIDIELAIDRYQIGTSSRCVNSNDEGFVIPCIDGNNKIQEIIEFVIADFCCGYPLYDGDVVKIAHNPWKKHRKYYYEGWGDKAYFIGNEIMNRQGYKLESKKCFVGEHLLQRAKDMPVIITKHATEAFELSIIDDSHIYLALGHCDKISAPPLDSKEAREILKGRDVKEITDGVEGGFPVHAHIYHELNNGTPIEEILKEIYKHCKKMVY